MAPVVAVQKQSIPFTAEGAARRPWPKAAASTEGLPWPLTLRGGSGRRGCDVVVCGTDVCSGRLRTVSGSAP